MYTGLIIVWRVSTNTRGKSLNRQSIFLFYNNNKKKTNYELYTFLYIWTYVYIDTYKRM